MHLPLRGKSHLVHCVIRLLSIREKDGCIASSSCSTLTSSFAPKTDQLMMCRFHRAGHIMSIRSHLKSTSRQMKRNWMMCVTVSFSVLNTECLQKNTCSAEHNAIVKANVGKQGYLVSGCGAAFCTRHSFVRKNGVADLKKGEK